MEKYGKPMNLDPTCCHQNQKSVLTLNIYIMFSTHIHLFAYVEVFNVECIHLMIMLNLYITFSIYFHTLPCIYSIYTLNAFKCIQSLPALCKPKVVNTRPPLPFPQWPLSLPGYHPSISSPSTCTSSASSSPPSLQPDPSPHCSNCHPLQPHSFLPLVFLYFCSLVFHCQMLLLFLVVVFCPVKRFPRISLSIIPPSPSPLLYFWEHLAWDPMNQ